MCVQRRVFTGMLHYHRLAVAAFRAAECDATVACRLDRCSGWRRVVDPFVRSPFLQYRMPASRVVAGTDSRKLYRGTDECAPFAVPVTVVVTDFTVAVFVTDRPIRRAAIREFGRQDGSIPQFFSFQVLLFEQDAEMVAGAYLQREIDVPAENGRQFHDLPVRQPGFLAVYEQRRLDDPGCRGDAVLQRPADRFHDDLVIRNRKRHAFDTISVPFKYSEFAILIELKAQFLAWTDLRE